MSDEVGRGMNIIIFEGGVAGGLSSLFLFKELISRVRAIYGSDKVDELFEVMAGTGTGALIVCMLGLLNMDIDQAIKTYIRIMECVFSEKKISMSGSGKYKASKLEEELKKMVREATGDENALLISDDTERKGRNVMIFAMSEKSLTASTPRIFRSYPVSSNQMPNCPMWQAVRASMAHPELFKSFTVSDGVVGESLVGGDVGCSNPARHVLAEVSAVYSDRHASSIVCIGAGHTRTIKIPGSNPLQRYMPTNVLVAMKDVATDSERVAQEISAQFEGTSRLYWRFSVDQGLQDVRASQWQRSSEVMAHTRSYTQKEEINVKMSEAAQAVIERNTMMSVAYISGKAQQPTAQQATGIKMCPAPSAVFTGCEDQVSQVVNCLLGPTKERRICVIHGLGGSGKTQIALKAVERTLDSWTDVVYVDATSSDTAEATLKGFATAKKIGDSHNDAIRWLESSTKPWLLVFDNADNPDLGLPSLIPGGTRGSVLVTTRLRTLGQLGQGPGSECRVGGMDGGEAIELLMKKSRRQFDELCGEEKEAARLLVEDVGCLALAIVHAGAYVWCSNISLVKYRTQCQKHMQSALERYSKLPASVEQYSKTVYTTWVMSYERLSRNSQHLLWFLAYLHHDMIQEDMFRRAAANIDYEPSIPTDIADETAWTYVKDYLRNFLDSDDNWDPMAFSKVVDELLSYSLIDYDRVNDGYAVHVLVQDWSRTMVTYTLSTSRTHTSHLLALSIDNSNEAEAYAYRRGLLLHVNTILGTSGMVDANDAKYLAKVYEENGHWDQEGRLLEHVLDKQRSLHGDGHLDTLASMGELASSYSNQGRWDEAEALQVQVLDAHRKQLGEHHPDTLSSMNNLASTYSKQGRWDEAEALQVKVLDAHQKQLGEHHPDTLICMNNLASTYSKQGRWDEAEVLEVQVLDARQKQLGEHHPDTLRSKNNLAMTYSNQGRWDEAEVLQVQVLDAHQKQLGEHHPDTLRSMSNLASTYSDQGQWDKAEALQVQVLDARQKQLGKHHPDTLTSMSNLAMTYSDQGRWDEAEALQVQVLDAHQKQLGEHHPDTLRSMSNLASTYSDQGRWDEAEALQVQVLDAHRKQLGEHHPDTLSSMNNLASTYSKQGRWDEAEALQVKVLDAHQKQLGEHHPDTLICMNNLASTYSKQGRWDEAEVLEVQVLDARQKQLGEHHPDTLRSKNNLAMTYSNQGRWDEAEVLQVQVLDAHQKQLGERHPDTLRSKNNLAMTYSYQGRWDEAEVLQVQALDARQKQLGERHPDTLTSMYNLALIYESRNKLTEAETLLTRTVAGCKHVYGEYHHETLDALQRLSATYEAQGPEREYELQALNEEIERVEAGLNE